MKSLQRSISRRKVPLPCRAQGAQSTGAINSVTNLSDRKNYEFTEDQACSSLMRSRSRWTNSNEFARNSRSRKSSFELK